MIPLISPPLFKGVGVYFTFIITSFFLSACKTEDTLSVSVFILK